MGIRDWLAIIVIVFIVLILLDGVRRKWIERKKSLRVKLDKTIPPADGPDEDDALIKSELPNGGARIVNRGDDDYDDFEDGEAEVPVLRESVEISEDDIEEYASEEGLHDRDYEEEFEETDDGIASFSALDDEPEGLDDWTDDESEEGEVDEEDIEVEDEEQSSQDDPWNTASTGTKDETAGDLPEESAADTEQAPKKAKRSFLGGRENDADRVEPSFGDEDMTFSHDEQGELDLEHNDLFEGTGHEDDEPEENDEDSLAEEVIIINVMARQGESIDGSKLLPVLLKQGLRLGEMSIFHRHADRDGKGPVMFSMANMLKPGTFSMSEMETLETPGVSFFMQIPNKVGNMQCFDKMLKTAEAVKDALDAQLKDENRSVFTRQTIEHSRQRIRDFELELLARK